MIQVGSSSYRSLIWVLFLSSVVDTVNAVTCATTGGSATCTAASNMAVSDFGDLVFLFLLFFVACFLCLISYLIF